MSDPSENNFSDHESVDPSTSTVPNAPVDGDLYSEPTGDFHQANFNPPYGPPLMLGPTFPSPPFVPPPLLSQECAPSSTNENVPLPQNLPQSVLQEQPLILLPLADNQNENVVVSELQIKSVAEWLKAKSFSQSAEESKPRQTFNFLIHEYRNGLEECMSNIRELEEVSVFAKGNVENLSREEWKGLRRKMDKLKKIVNYKVECVTDQDVLSAVKIQLEKRQKKRRRLRRRNKEYREERVKTENDRKIMSQQIDDWMRAQAEKAASAKRDEQLKKEAQLVLSEVTRRTTEANRQLELLSGLEKLRLLKLRLLPQNQQKSRSVDSPIVFENLKRMWNAKLKDYELEEQGLKVMLSEANQETIKSERCVEEEALKWWETVLFGEDDSHQFFSDFNELLVIRNQWDKFVIPPDMITATMHLQISSSIPIGWVVPSAPTTPAWKKFIDA